MQAKWWKVSVKDKDGLYSTVNAPTFTKWGARLFARIHGLVPKGAKIEKVEEKKD